MTFLKFRTSRGQSTWVFECAVGRPYAIKNSPSDAYDTERWVRAAAGPTYATHVDSVVPKTTLLLVPIPGRVAVLGPLIEHITTVEESVVLQDEGLGA